MGQRLKSVLFLLPGGAMAVAAALIWNKARQGGFNSMMGFPLVFAAIATLMVVVALFVGNRAHRSRRWMSAGLLLLSAALAWGAAWSHHRYFERQREALERQGQAAFAGRVLDPISFVEALNTSPNRDQVLFALNQPHVLVNVWATWCSPCVQEMPMLERFWQEHRGSGVAVVGVTRLTSLDPGDRAEEIAAITAFLDEHDVTYPILVVDDETYDRFGPQRLPTSLWLENGTVQDYRVTVEGTKAILEAIEARLAAG